jgi:succinyl-diaminopimelate desuccinylase
VAIAGHIDTVPINANLPTRDIEIDGEPISGVAGPWT